MNNPRSLPKGDGAGDSRAGFFYALAAYGLWGFLPLYMKLVDHIDPVEVVANRAFWSLPVGQYEVTATYGIQVRGRAEVVKLKCHDKVKKAECKDEVTRLMEVVPLDKMPPPEMDKEGKPVKKACDWIVE